MLCKHIDYINLDGERMTVQCKEICHQDIVYVIFISFFISLFHCSLFSLLHSVHLFHSWTSSLQTYGENSWKICCLSAIDFNSHNTISIEIWISGMTCYYIYLFYFWLQSHKRHKKSSHLLWWTKIDVSWGLFFSFWDSILSSWIKIMLLNYFDF